MTLWRWIISHIWSWMTVYVLCCNAQTNLIVVDMSCIGIVMHSLFVNCPAVICEPSMLFIFHGEDTTSELWTPVHSFTLITIYYKLCSLLFTANKHYLPHYMFNPLFSARLVRLTTSLYRWGKVSWLCVCRFHVALTPIVCPATVSGFNLGSYFFLLLIW